VTNKDKYNLFKVGTPMLTKKAGKMVGITRPNGTVYTREWVDDDSYPDTMSPKEFAWVDRLRVIHPQKKWPSYEKAMKEMLPVSEETIEADFPKEKELPILKSKIDYSHGGKLPAYPQREITTENGIQVGNFPPDWPDKMSAKDFAYKEKLWKLSTQQMGKPTYVQLNEAGDREYKQLLAKEKEDDAYWKERNKELFSIPNMIDDAASAAWYGATGTPGEEDIDFMQSTAGLPGGGGYYDPMRTTDIQKHILEQLSPDYYPIANKHIVPTGKDGAPYRFREWLPFSGVPTDAEGNPTGEYADLTFSGGATPPQEQYGQPYGWTHKTQGEHNSIVPGEYVRLDGEGKPLRHLDPAMMNQPGGWRHANIGNTTEIDPGKYWNLDEHGLPAPSGERSSGTKMYPSYWKKDYQKLLQGAGGELDKISEEIAQLQTLKQSGGPTDAAGIDQQIAAKVQERQALEESLLPYIQPKYDHETGTWANAPTENAWNPHYALKQRLLKDGVIESMDDPITVRTPQERWENYTWGKNEGTPNFFTLAGDTHGGNGLFSHQKSNLLGRAPRIGGGNRIRNTVGGMAQAINAGVWGGATKVNESWGAPGRNFFRGGKETGDLHPQIVVYPDGTTAVYTPGEAALQGSMDIGLGLVDATIAGGAFTQAIKRGGGKVIPQSWLPSSGTRVPMSNLQKGAIGTFWADQVGTPAASPTFTSDGTMRDPLLTQGLRKMFNIHAGHSSGYSSATPADVERYRAQHIQAYGNDDGFNMAVGTPIPDGSGNYISRGPSAIGALQGGGRLGGGANSIGIDTETPVWTEEYMRSNPEDSIQRGFLDADGNLTDSGRDTIEQGHPLTDYDPGGRGTLPLSELPGGNDSAYQGGHFPYQYREADGSISTGATMGGGHTFKYTDLRDQFYPTKVPYGEDGRYVDLKPHSRTGYFMGPQEYEYLKNVEGFSDEQLNTYNFAAPWDPNTGMVQGGQFFPYETFQTDHRGVDFVSQAQKAKYKAEDEANARAELHKNRTWNPEGANFSVDAGGSSGVGMSNDMALPYERLMRDPKYNDGKPVGNIKDHPKNMIQPKFERPRFGPQNSYPVSPSVNLQEDGAIDTIHNLAREIGEANDNSKAYGDLFDEQVQGQVNEEVPPVN